MSTLRRLPSTSDASGFTLLELIVAAGILALIAVFSWRGLDALIRERGAIAASQESLDRLQRTFARIERDALLASDAQVDDGRALRLVSGSAGVSAASLPAVEYRVVEGRWTRTVAGDDAAPLVLLDSVANVTIEAWLPAPRGGAWVRNKAPASEAPRQAARSGGTNDANAAPGTSSPGAPPGTALPSPPAGSTGSTASPNGNPNANATITGNLPPTPVVAAATGIRLVIARADGSTVTRAFLVGGG